jgi:energy-coupling factor transporter ATP-binding protein EcfA2
MSLPKPVEKLLRFFAPAKEEPSEPQYHYIERPTPAARERSNEGGSFPRFQATAGDHVDPRTADRFAMIRARLRNAYTPQPVTDRRVFAGRTRVLTALIGSIEEQRLHAVICGERGIGKSSLLHMLAGAATDARYLVVYLACTAGSDFDETFRTIAANIPLAFHHGYGPTSIEGERGDRLSQLLGPEPITVRYAVDLLAKIEGTRALVILDEFDRAGSEDFRRSITDLLWSLSDQAVRVQFVIAGVAANAGELVANVTHRDIFAMQLPRMTAAEIRSLIKNGEAVAELEFDDPAVQAIIARCIGFPYLASLISHRAALVAVDQNRLNVVAQHVDVGTHEAVEELRGRISPRSQMHVTEGTRLATLRTVAALAEAALNTSGWFTLNAGQARVAADRLAGQNLLLETRDDGVERTYRFTDPNVPIFIWLLAVQEVS